MWGDQETSENLKKTGQTGEKRNENGRKNSFGVKVH